MCSCLILLTKNNLEQVIAKVYYNPVPILEPEIVEVVATTRKRQNVATFVGRKMEKRAIHSIVTGMIEERDVAQSTIVFLTGDSGFGKVRFL
jgi:hypothetical protein